MIDRATRELQKQRQATFELEEQRYLLEERRIELEHQKLALEERKLEFENRKVAINLYVEDFKARWQEIAEFRK